MTLENYWPKSLKHISDGLVKSDTEYITIAQINKKEKNGFPGTIHLYTALIPFEEVREVIETVGGIGWRVKSWGPDPIVGNDEVYDSKFWIPGKSGTDVRYQTIVNSWYHNDKAVMLPDNIFFMVFGLVPRYLEDGIMSWDDPSLPVHDVVIAKSTADFSLPPTEVEAYIKVKRSYLERYCAMKKTAAVHVFYEDRKSNDDETIIETLNGSEGREFDLKGRKLSLAIIKDLMHQQEYQFSRVWGTSLALMPDSRSNEPKLDLSWPDIDSPKHKSYFMEYACIRDEVLVKYENKHDFTIFPISGDVSCGSWW